MTESKPTLTTDLHAAVSALRTLRDDIRLHVHLAGMDAKDRWAELDAEFEGLMATTKERSEKTVAAMTRTFEEFQASLKHSKSESEKRR